LPAGNYSRSLTGDEHGIGVSLIFVGAQPGQGPSLHTHPYEEIHVVQEGEALFVAGDEERVVRAGEIVVAPANVPHSFVNQGSEVFREVAIHANGRFVTDWLERD
jgi:quercetin dioxygenase-like cupin family protein